MGDKMGRRRPGCAAHLGHGGVDADELIKVGLGGVEQQRHAKALKDLARVGAEKVQAQHALLLIFRVGSRAL